MKVSETPHGMSETYTVKFWYENTEEFWQQIQKDFYSNSKAAHQAVETFATKALTKLYKNFRIISVIYN